MNIKTWPRVAITLAILGLVLQSAAAMAKPATLNGTVAYRERMALPPSAVVEVKLVDVSLADAPSRTIAETSVRPKRQVPIPYRLRFDDARIKAGGTYALQAQIIVDGQLWFATTTRHPVFAGGTDNTNIVVERVGASPDANPPLGLIEQPGPSGKWLAEDIQGRGVIDRLQTVLEIALDGTVTGTGGCNSMHGNAALSGDRITFGAIASTKMACTPSAMNQERRFFVMLGTVRSWRVDSAKSKLLLFDARGRRIAVLAQM